eukprot:CAMPEP_0185846372 /NCGR_PEP_ID=MMETSP1354-20130828/2035_1 /TAXON_ID=708628 /ORGANISM="Erythrolobus madagascarensis, Strain CCMP3276" /LENGTH=515 /DNA_ID=CAMNT_0028546499 /DNA_START=32 /DNA_END=1579 /DNA_ORIENTATION=+
MTEPTIEVTIKCVGSASEGAGVLKLQLERDGTVESLKRAVRLHHPSQPCPSSQKLVFKGRVLHDTICLSELHNSAGDAAELVVHLVISTSSGASPPANFADGNSTQSVTPENSEVLHQEGRYSGSREEYIRASGDSASTSSLPEAEPHVSDGPGSRVRWPSTHDFAATPAQQVPFSFYAVPPAMNFSGPPAYPPWSPQDADPSSLYAQQMWQAYMMQAYVDAQLHYAHAMNQYYAGTERGGESQEQSGAECTNETVRASAPQRDIGQGSALDSRNVHTPSSSGLRQRVTTAQSTRGHANQPDRHRVDADRQEVVAPGPGQVPRNGEQGALGDGFRGFALQLELNWGLMLKLAFLVFLLAQEGSPVRIAGLAFAAVLIYLWQMGRFDFVHRAVARYAPLMNQVQGQRNANPIRMNPVRVHERAAPEGGDVRHAAGGLDHVAEAAPVAPEPEAPTVPNSEPGFAYSAAQFVHGFVLSLLPTWRPAPQEPRGAPAHFHVVRDGAGDAGPADNVQDERG